MKLRDNTELWGEIAALVHERDRRQVARGRDEFIGLILDAVDRALAAPSPGTGTAAVPAKCCEKGRRQLNTEGECFLIVCPEHGTSKPLGELAAQYHERSYNNCPRGCLGPHVAGSAPEPVKPAATKCERWCGTGKFPAKGAYYQANGVYYCTDSCAHVARTPAAEPGKPATCETCKDRRKVLYMYPRGPSDLPGNAMIPCPTCRPVATPGKGGRP